MGTKTKLKRQRRPRQQIRTKVKNSQYGLGMNVFHGSRIQRGYGLGSILGGLFRKALPYLWKGAKYAGKTALRTGANVANDVIDGQNIRASIKARSAQAGKRIANNVTDSILSKVGVQAGRGRKRSVKRGVRKYNITSSKATKRSTSRKPSKRGKQSAKVRAFKGHDIFGHY